MSNNENKSLISINHVSKKYGHHVALDDFSVNLESGSIVGLLGPNGSGKTTLLKILAGLIRDYTGNVMINGLPVGEQSKAIVSYLSDESYFPKWMKIEDALRIYCDFYDDFDLEKAMRMLDEMNLNPKMGIKTLSKGMNEKFLLTLCMCRNAYVYLLDEPIAGVDPAAREEIMNTILNNYNQEGLIVISTHLVKDIERIFDDVLFIKDGNLILHKNADDLRNSEGKSIDQLFIEVFRNA